MQIGIRRRFRKIGTALLAALRGQLFVCGHMAVRYVPCRPEQLRWAGAPQLGLPPELGTRDTFDPVAVPSGKAWGL